MMRLADAERFTVAFSMSIALGACGTTYVRTGERTVSPLTTRPAKQPKSLSQIDLSEIGHIAPKGRVQDRDYNELKVVDELLENGKQSIPFLISKLDDDTVIHNQIMDFWPQITVGDVALIILSDFSTDSTWTKQTIPGTSWNELFETKADPNAPAWEYFGCPDIKTRETLAESKMAKDLDDLERSNCLGR